MSIPQPHDPDPQPVPPGDAVKPTPRPASESHHPSGTPPWLRVDKDGKFRTEGYQPP